MTRAMRWICWLLVSAGALSALHVAASRWSVESAGRNVEITLDWDEVRGLADLTQSPSEGVLRRFYSAGARGIAISEDTLGSLQAVRRIEVLTSIGDRTTRLFIPDANLRARIASALEVKWGIHPTADDFHARLTVPVTWTDLSGLGVGLPADVLATARGAGLEPVARLLNFEGATPETIAAVARDVRAAGGRLIVFGGDQTLGYPDGLKAASRAMQANRLVFGQVEFGKQKGEDGLARLLNGDIVRVHSVSPADMGRLSEADVTDRFVRAAEERNIRDLYVRLLPGAQMPPVEENLRYVNGIAAALNDRGYPPGFAAPFRAWDSHPVSRAVIGLGVAAGTVLLADALMTLGLWLSLALLLLAALDVVAPAATSIGRKIVALQATLVFPVLAMTLLRSWAPLVGRAREGSVTRSLLSWPTLGRFLAVAGISLLGALAVVGVLSNRMASVKLLEFSGIKLQQTGTLLAVAAICFLDIAPRGGRRAETEHLSRRVGQIWSQPVALGSLLATLAVLVALAMLMARSGNDPGVGVSPLEMRFRAVLDQVLGVRPRTKEFLIGHPALFLGIALALLRRVRWAVPLLIVGAVGQAGMVNTFCHLHTPLAISVMRTVNGFWVGLVVAIVAALVFDRFQARAPSGLAERIPAA